MSTYEDSRNTTWQSRDGSSPQPAGTNSVLLPTQQPNSVTTTEPIPMESPMPVVNKPSHEDTKFYKHWTQLEQEDPTFNNMVKDMAPLTLTLRESINSNEMPPQIATKRIEEAIGDHRFNATNDKETLRLAMEAGSEYYKNNPPPKNGTPQEISDYVTGPLTKSILGHTEGVTPSAKPGSGDPFATEDRGTSSPKVDGVTGGGGNKNKEPSKPGATPYQWGSNTYNVDSTKEGQTNQKPGNAMIGKPADGFPYVMQTPEQEAAKEALEKEIEKTAPKPEGNIVDGELNPETTAKVTGKPGSNPDKIKALEKQVKATSDEMLASEVGKADSSKFKGDWESDNHFWGAATQFFMNIMGGAPIGDAYMAAGQYYDDNVSADKRASYANELLGDYTKPSVQEWVRTGDSSTLTSNQAGELEDLKTQLAQQKLNYAPGRENLEREEILSRIRKNDASARKSALGEGGSDADRSQSENQAYQGAKAARAGNDLWNQQYFGQGGDYTMTDFSSKIAGDILAKNNPGYLDMAIRGMSDKTKAAENRERSFLRGILRPESGAAIANSEWSNYGNIFFPRDGDKPADLARKAVLREMSIKNLEKLGKVNFGSSEEEKAATAKQVANLEANLADVVEYDPRSGAYWKRDGSAHDDLMK
jgi:hypothetical protein